ncbi:protein translocase subunit SecA-like isoform X1 [Gossypium australe]|uniref:Protein translocase subunit SecA-like isoform X1 n=1 Tax=Gossypium australe TaxID=47621 RepID=A0A5B6VUE4_9ROSI|nr:protein translocase subunit SecA-like isoform X1 [Gossypium australe]
MHLSLSPLDMSFVLFFSLLQVQKLMGSTPLDLAKFNMAKSGEMSRNAPCPCGSKKRYKSQEAHVLWQGSVDSKRKGMKSEPYTNLGLSFAQILNELV